MISWFSEPIAQLQNTVLTMGNFDGLHLGHQRVLDELSAQAKQLNAGAVILTYLEHPGHYVHFSHPVRILTPRDCKKSLIQAMGFVHVYFLNFSSQTAHISAADFLSDVICRYFHPQMIIAGYDTHFGYQREGNADFLIRNEPQFGYRTIQVKPVYLGDKIISSSLIRSHLIQGDISQANAMLGKPYRLYGCVTHGQKLGRIIGFPTINLNLTDPEQLIPAQGIYLTCMNIRGKHYFGLTNIGTSPTLKMSDQIEIETYILDFDHDIYDEDIELDFLHRIRQEKHFSSVDELKAAIRDDITKGKELIKERYEDI